MYHFITAATLVFSSFIFSPPSEGGKDKPISLHPANPHYFQWKGKPAVLITSGEHYGAVINLDFDYNKYFDELKKHSFNLTRIFSGTYREVEGSFNLIGNTLAPRSGSFVCPWGRSGTPGASDGGNKFDLTEWDPVYMNRLNDFITQAGKHGLVVELVLFCTMYDEKLWEASPMNIINNINNAGGVKRTEIYSGKEDRITTIQKELVIKLVKELNKHNNLYYEICNEPYERGGLTKEWNDGIVDVIVSTEIRLPKKHLIAQNFHPSSVVTDLNPNISVLNFHAARPENVSLNYSLNKAIAFDETGGRDQSDVKYRREGWEFILAGGGVYNNLDMSFTTDQEDGSFYPVPEGTPCGGGLTLRKQLAIMKKFMEGFDFINMSPGEKLVRKFKITPSQAEGRQSSEPEIRIMEEPGKNYAIYINKGTGAELELEIPPGKYRIRWLDTKDGQILKSARIIHNSDVCRLVSPPYTEDITVGIMRIM